MKIVCIVLLTIITLSGTSQKCNNLVSSVVFQQKFNQMAAKPNDELKYGFGSTFANSTCLTADQVRLMASMFSHDIYRLEFCKIAYQRTMDQSNFYDVYDSFSSFSAAFRLHDYVTGISNTSIETPVVETVVIETPVIKPKPVTFPSINYPSYGNYNGDTGCESPMSEADFLIVVKDLFKLSDDNAIAAKAIEIADDNCLSMAQMMKVASVIKLESKRMGAMKEMIFAVYDLGNYTFATALFSHAPYQKSWIAYCESEVVEPPCTTSDSEHSEMLKQLGSESFADDRIVIAKQILDNHCLSVEQIKGFMKKFTFDKRKMEVAKYAYDNCTDTKNYYQLSGLFDFSSEKQAFNSWLNNQ